MTPQIAAFTSVALAIAITFLIVRADRLASETHKAMMQRLRRPERE